MDGLARWLQSSTSSVNTYRPISVFLGPNANPKEEKGRRAHYWDYPSIMLVPAILVRTLINSKMKEKKKQRILIGIRIKMEGTSRKIILKPYIENILRFWELLREGRQNKARIVLELRLKEFWMGKSGRISDNLNPICAHWRKSLNEIDDKFSLILFTSPNLTLLWNSSLCMILLFMQSSLQECLQMAIKEKELSQIQEGKQK